MKDEQGDQTPKPLEEPDTNAGGILGGAIQQTQTNTVKDYWEHYKLGDATAAVHQGITAEGEPEVHQLDVGGGGQLQPETHQETLLSTEIIVPALPAIETATNQSTKHKSMSVFDMKWNKHLEALKAFKDEHGHINVPRREEYMKLYKFLENQGQNYRKLIEGKKSTLTVQRIRDLDELGVKWKVEPEQIILGLPKEDPESDIKLMNKQDEAWNNRFEQLKKFHIQSGHFRVPYKINNKGTKRPRDANDPDEETLKLGTWVKRQRSHYASDMLSAERVEKLNSIGFVFKPGRQTKNQKLEVQLGLLDALRKRNELNASQIADLNYLYDEWKRRGETNSSSIAFGNSSLGSSSNNKHDNKWANNFEKLKAFKLKHGHMRIPRDENTEFKALAKWTDRMREQHSKRQRGEKNSLNDSRVERLESIGFCWKIRQDTSPMSLKKALQNDPMANIPVDIDLSQVFISQESDADCIISYSYRHRWNTKLDEFKRYQAKFGIPRVTAKVIQMYPDYLSQLQELRKWIENQRTFYQNGLHGKKNSLSDERIRLLMQANFDFSSNRCQSLHYKSWNEKLQELKEFKQIHGHTRVKPTDKTDPLFKLSKWVQNQRTHYWMLIKGEKSCINKERIEALEALGFEWRLKPGRTKKSQVDPANKTGNAEHVMPTVLLKDCNRDVIHDSEIEQQDFV